MISEWKKINDSIVQGDRSEEIRLAIFHFSLVDTEPTDPIDSVIKGVKRWNV